MEIEELKSNWEAMSKRVEHLEILNKKNIMEITKQRYKNKFNHIFKYEFIGSVVCYIAAIVIMLNFNKLSTPLLITCGIFVCLFLIVVPFLTIRNLNKIKTIRVGESDYKTTLKRFEKAKRLMLKTQQLAIPAGIIGFLASLPVFNALIGNKDFIENFDTSRIISFTIALIFMFLFSRWGYKKYEQIADSAGNILKDLEE
ncbi:hypothetical protein ULMS_22150 [Patiriisocius marinistellae]|uniref:Uncharacterized protein n=1 Tax=Patiriisocius marinistellae TaxID=2494560 RepID=A0A5J4FVK5_9FLAO|nr:hypothetical protein [Patiriisocius marinistellae]GEQ86707.1 hypothetical protein ULMS_22150 [Patiriisocius marinistellae]